MSLESAVEEILTWGGQPGSFRPMRHEERSRHRALIKSHEDLKYPNPRSGYERDELYDMFTNNEKVIVPSMRHKAFEYRLMQAHERKDFGL